MRYLKRYFELNENAQLANKILLANEYDSENPDFLELKHLMRKSPSLLGTFTLFLVEQNISLVDIKRLISLMQINKASLNKLPKAIQEYDEFNRLFDAVDEIEHERIARKLLNQVTGDLRRELYELEPDKLQPYIDLAATISNDFEEEEIKIFTTSLSRVKDLDDLMIDMRLFIDKMKADESYLQLITMIEESTSKIVYKSSKDNIIVARISEYIDSYKLGSFKWCISNETGFSSWQSYVENDNNAQYFAWNLNYKKHESLYIVGITIKKDGTIRECQDSQNRALKFEDFLSSSNLPKSLFRPLNKKELKEKEAEKEERAKRLAEFEEKLRLERKRIRTERAARREESGEWDNDPIPNALLKYLIQIGDLDEGESVYVLEEQDYKHYDLRAFNIGEKEWAIGTDQEADDSAFEYMSQVVDESGVYGNGNRGLIEMFINTQAVLDDYGYDYYTISSDPENYGVEKTIKDSAKEELDKLEERKSKLEEKKETKTIAKKIEEISDRIDELEDQDSDYWEYSDDSIQDKLDDLNNSIKEYPLDTLIEHDAVSFDKKYERPDESSAIKLKDYVNVDDYVRHCIEHDGRGHSISSYDGLENEIYYEGEFYYIYLLNK